MSFFKARSKDLSNLLIIQLMNMERIFLETFRSRRGRYEYMEIIILLINQKCVGVCYLSPLPFMDRWAPCNMDDGT